MNYNKKNSTNRQNKNLINTINQKVGWLKIFSNNRLEHELVKFQLMWYLKNLGWNVWSEAEFNSPYSGRADIFAVQGSSYVIIEVLDSETESECLVKCKTYPGYPESIIMVQASKFDINHFKL